MLSSPLYLHIKLPPNNQKIKKKKQPYLIISGLLRRLEAEGRRFVGRDAVVWWRWILGNQISNFCFYSSAKKKSHTTIRLKYKKLNFILQRPLLPICNHLNNPVYVTRNGKYGSSDKNKYRVGTFLT